MYFLIWKSSRLGIDKTRWYVFLYDSKRKVGRRGRYLSRKGFISWNKCFEKGTYVDSTVLFKTKEEAEQQLKKWFETQPPEVFAKYIAQRMEVAK